MNIQRVSKSQQGFAAHYILPVLVIVVVAAIGVYLFGRSNAASCTSYTYSQGSKGTCVKYIQQLVNYQNKGNPYGSTQITADGDFGPKTKSAVVATQKQFRLSADGIVGPKTWKEICSPHMSMPKSFPLTSARAAGCDI